MKRFFFLIIAAALAALCAFGLGACGDVDKPDSLPKTEKFYAYDVETDEYDDSDYITLSGTTAAWFSPEILTETVIEFNGNVKFDGKGFVMTLNGSFSVLDTCVITYKGERESNGVLRIDSTVIAAYSNIVAEPIVTTDVSVRYYCKKSRKPNGDNSTVLPPDPTTIANYCLYSSADESYDQAERIGINGDVFTVHLEKGISGMKPLTLVGSVTERKGNEFKAACEMDIKSLSDYKTDRAISDIASSLGVAPNGIEFYAKLEVSCSGYIYDSTIRSSLLIKVSGFSGKFDSLNFTNNVHSIYSYGVYCPEGTTPDFSVNVTFDMDGGTLNGRNKVVVRTESDGTIVTPNGTPVKKDMGFYNYYYKGASNYEFMLEPNQITYSERTFYAKWMPYVNITYVINSDEYEFADKSQSTASYMSGKPIGAANLPKLVAKVQNPKTRFKGWYDENDVQLDPTYMLSGLKTNVVYTAKWHSEQEVNYINDRLQNYYMYRVARLYIHFVPAYHSDQYKDGWSGGKGGGYVCPEKDGIKDETQRCSLDGVDYDISGYFFTMFIGDGAYYSAWNGKEYVRVDFDGINFYIELDHSDGVRRSYYIKVSDLDKTKPNHIFVRDGSDEYTDKW